MAYILVDSPHRSQACTSITTMSSEKPFQIAISDREIDLLRQRLVLAHFPNELDGDDKLQGPSLTTIKRLVQRWRSGYSWRAQEAKLNAEFPQFTRDIDVDGFGTLNIHYIHKKSTIRGAIPLLFIHGWPGSFLEVRKILPLLINAPAGEPSFHVVALSLPGFAFSEGPKKTGFKLGQYAEVCL